MYLYSIIKSDFKVLLLERFFSPRRVDILDQNSYLKKINFLKGVLQKYSKRFFSKNLTFFLLNFELNYLYDDLLSSPVDDEHAEYYNKKKFLEQSLLPKKPLKKKI